jgi:hypothetical protein
MYFCPRKNGPVEERVQLFSAIHLKLAKKSKKLSNFFQQQKIEILHQTAPNTVCIDIA